MLAIISPAKRLDFGPTSTGAGKTEPAFLDDTALLVKRARRLSRKKLVEMMGISKDLADLNYQRFQSFEIEDGPRGAKQSILAFKGDAYLGLDAPSLDEKDLAFAQDHLRILSGLYGLLRPLDEIQPYRLEMGSKLDTRRGKDLYKFWGDQITDAINEVETDVIVNLASKEYFSAANPAKLKAKIITPVFQEEKNGKARVLFMFAKQARGMMARYIIQNRLDEPEGMKAFDTGGYKYQPDQSDDVKWVFQRPQPAAKR